MLLQWHDWDKKLNHSFFKILSNINHKRPQKWTYRERLKFIVETRGSQTLGSSEKLFKCMLR